MMDWVLAAGFTFLVVLFSVKWTIEGIAAIREARENKKKTKRLEHRRGSK